MAKKPPLPKLNELDTYLKLHGFTRVSKPAFYKSTPSCRTLYNQDTRNYIPKLYEAYQKLQRGIYQYLKQDTLTGDITIQITYKHWFFVKTTPSDTSADLQDATEFFEKLVEHVDATALEKTQQKKAKVEKLSDIIFNLLRDVDFTEGTKVNKGGITHNEMALNTDGDGIEKPCVISLAPQYCHRGNRSGRNRHLCSVYLADPTAIEQIRKCILLFKVISTDPVSLLSKLES